MIFALTISNNDQERIAREVIGFHRVAAEIMPYHVKQDMEEQLLGRDSIAHHARHQAQQGLQHVIRATHGLGLAAGINMAPEGIFLICAAVTLSRTGHEVAGWSTPRIIPEPVCQEITSGGNFDELIRRYRQQWKSIDIFSMTDIDELISRHNSYAEAITSALDAIAQGHS